MTICRLYGHMFKDQETGELKDVCMRPGCQRRFIEPERLQRLREENQKRARRGNGNG